MPEPFTYFYVQNTAKLSTNMRARPLIGFPIPVQRGQMIVPAFIKTLRAALISACTSALLLGCGPSGVPDPFAFNPGIIPGDAGTDADTQDGSIPGPSDPEIGGPCIDDGQCNDNIACTLDTCDQSLLRCRFAPDDSTCQNGFYCDGVERCNTKLGCTFGEPVGCTDTSSCTIDACNELTQACTHTPRDADEDGDIDNHCPGGKDCDDANPNISSLQAEVCGNFLDDNCNTLIDEATCTAPQHDTCADPLEISAPGIYALNTAGASFHYATSCAMGNQAQMRDVVAALILPPGPPINVELSAKTNFADVSLALAGQCGDAASELACSPFFNTPSSGKIAKLIGRNLGDPAQSKAYPVYITSTQNTAVSLEAVFLPGEAAPQNETCGTAAPITPNMPIQATIIDAAKDLSGQCDSQLGELVYSFDLAQKSNVDVYASSIDGDGQPILSLRNTLCALPEDEIVCQAADNAHVFWQSLDPGTYYIAVSATAPTTQIITLAVSPPTDPAPDDQCSTAPPITPNKTISIDYKYHQDDLSICQTGMTDAAYTLELQQTSDVLIVQRISQGDVGAISLSQAACADPNDLLACNSGSPSPVRTAKHAVPPGDYRVISESIQGQPMQLTAFVRNAVPPLLIPFADGCADALEIPPTGGFFQGNTANANADFKAGCDQGGLSEPGGAPDQMLKINLPAKKRVVLDMYGSAYPTLLDVRKGPDCPGTEVSQGCTVGYNANRSFLDLELDPGLYYIQIDGYALSSGPWFLDVRVVDP